MKEVVNRLLICQEEGLRVCCDINGVMLFSDTVTIDSAYQQIIGKSKAELTMEEAKEIIESQNHHIEITYYLVCMMVLHFCERGNEFVQYVNSTPVNIPSIRRRIRNSTPMF